RRRRLFDLRLALPRRRARAAGGGQGRRDRRRRHLGPRPAAAPAFRDSAWRAGGGSRELDEVIWSVVHGPSSIVHGFRDRCAGWDHRAESGWTDLGTRTW